MLFKLKMLCGNGDHCLFFDCYQTGALAGFTGFGCVVGIMAVALVFAFDYDATFAVTIGANGCGSG